MEMNKLMPIPPPFSIFGAPTQIMVDGFPPRDVLIRTRIGTWPGRLLIASGCRIEDLWDAVADRWGALAIVTPARKSSDAKRIEVVTGNLQEELGRIWTCVEKPDGQASYGFQVAGGWLVWDRDVEVIAVMLPKKRETVQFARKVGEWLASYLRDGESVVKYDQTVEPPVGRDAAWVDRFVAGLAVILALRDHVTKFTRHLPEPLLVEPRRAAESLASK